MYLQGFGLCVYDACAFRNMVKISENRSFQCFAVSVTFRLGMCLSAVCEISLSFCLLNEVFEELSLPELVCRYFSVGGDRVYSC